MHKLFSQSQSIGIIGGADGPTSIVVATSNDWINYVAVLLVAVAVFSAIIIVKRRKK